MKRTPLKRKSATKRRTTSPRCAVGRCNKPGNPLCVTHAEQRADKLFSLFIRNRDGRCTANFPHDCDPANLQAAHVIGRRNQSVRYDPRNVHALCRGAHMLVDQHGREGIKYQWALSRLGLDAFLDLTEDSRAMTKRRDAAETALAWLSEAAGTANSLCSASPLSTRVLYESFGDDRRRASCKCGWSWDGTDKRTWLHEACEHWLETRAAL